MDFEKYVRLLIEDGRVRGRNSIATLVAIGAAESGLDNTVIGDNVKNGTPADNPAHYGLGLSWLQHDTYWLEQDRQINGVNWSVEQLRGDPQFAVDLLFDRPGMILYEGVFNTYIRFGLWTTFPAKSDEFMPQAEAAYDKVVAEMFGALDV